MIDDYRVPQYTMKKIIKFNQVRYQYIIVFGVNIISFCHGFAVGWLSSAVPILKSDETPLLSGPMTLEQTMMLGGLYPLGGFLGNCVFAVLVNYFGRITSMSFLAFPNIVYWLAVLLSTNFQQLIIGRFIAGMSGGGLFVAIPLFVAEIADKEIRGFFGLNGTINCQCWYLNGIYLRCIHRIQSCSVLHHRIPCFISGCNAFHTRNTSYFITTNKNTGKFTIICLIT